MATSTTILILNYNAGESLVRCLESLRASDAAGLPVLLVDNASKDASVEAARRVFPDLSILQLNDNVGFAGGMNAGLRELKKSPPDRVLLMNPDTLVAPEFLAPLEAALADGVSVAGPKLTLPGDPPRLWCAGGDVTFGLNLSRLRGHRLVDEGQFDRGEDVSFLPATVWLVPWQVLEKVGDFDETFFCYVEDVDYCIRLRQKGLRLRYVPESVVVHEGSSASGGGYTSLRKYLNALGSWTLLRKHGTAGRWARFLLCDVLTAPLALCYGLLQRRPKAALWKLRGLVDGFLGRPFSEKRRRELMPGTRS